MCRGTSYEKRTMGNKSGLVAPYSIYFIAYLCNHKSRIFLTMKKETVISIILQILIVIFATILIIQLSLKLTGHSPTETQVIYTIITALIIYLFSISYKLGRIDENLKTTNFRLSRIEDRLVKIENKI